MNIDEILEKSGFNRNDMNVYDKELKEAIKEIVKETLRMAAEDAKMRFHDGVNSKISERIKVEFALKILEELKQESPFPNYVPHQYINNKITELKNSINGK